MGDRLLVRLPALIRRLVAWLGNPLSTEASAFRWLVAVVTVVAVLTALALLLR